MKCRMKKVFTCKKDLPEGSNYVCSFDFDKPFTGSLIIVAKKFDDGSVIMEVTCDGNEYY